MTTILKDVFSHNSFSLSVLVFSRQKFLSLFPLKFILLSFLSHYIGITVCRPRQAEHAHIQLERQSTYNQRHHFQLRKSHYSDSTVKKLLKGAASLRFRLKATVVDSNC